MDKKDSPQPYLSVPTGLVYMRHLCWAIFFATFQGVTNAATSVASLHLLAKLTVFPKVSLVDPSQGTGKLFTFCHWLSVFHVIGLVRSTNLLRRWGVKMLIGRVDFSWVNSKICIHATEISQSRRLHFLFVFCCCCYFVLCFSKVTIAFYMTVVIGRLERYSML